MACSVLLNKIWGNLASYLLQTNSIWKLFPLKIGNTSKKDLTQDVRDASGSSADPSPFHWSHQKMSQWKGACQEAILRKKKNRQKRLRDASLQKTWSENQWHWSDEPKLEISGSNWHYIWKWSGERLEMAVSVYSHLGNTLEALS